MVPLALALVMNACRHLFKWQHLQRLPCNTCTAAHRPLHLQVRNILNTLVDVLRTPSSDVQRAVSDCLVPLMAGLAADREFVDGLIRKVLNLLTKGESYGDR
jgi:hypothetical protein